MAHHCSGEEGSHEVPPTEQGLVHEGRQRDVQVLQPREVAEAVRWGLGWMRRCLVFVRSCGFYVDVSLFVVVGVSGYVWEGM